MVRVGGSAQTHRGLSVMGGPPGVARVEVRVGGMPPLIGWGG